MIFDDLDPVDGGLPWIRGQLDDKRCWLLSEYLCASANGVEESLQHAAFCVAEYEQNEFTENDWLRRRWADAHKQQREGTLPAGADIFTQAFQNRSDTDVKREQRLDIYAPMSLMFMVQALDRLAPVIAIISAAGLRPVLRSADVLQLDWAAIAMFAEKARTGDDKPATTGKRRPHDQTDAGSALQRALFTSVHDAPSNVTNAPTDWLPWLLRSRNTFAHRAPKMTWKALLQDKTGRGTGFAEPFHAQPGWGEVETMLEQANLSRRRSGSALPILLDDTPLSTMTGLLRSTAELVEIICKELIKIVEARRSDPSVLVQPGAQWAEPLSVPTLNFPGYGNPPKTSAKEIILHPDTAKRLDAARIGSQWVEKWRT